jgi:hypothetical protein
VFDAVAHLLNLEVDLIFFDTTSTYCETEDPDPPVCRDDRSRVVDTDTNTEQAADGGAAEGEPPAGADRQGPGRVPQ